MSQTDTTDSARQGLKGMAQPRHYTTVPLIRDSGHGIHTRTNGTGQIVAHKARQLVRYLEQVVSLLLLCLVLPLS